MELHALPKSYQLAEYRIEKKLGEGGFGITYLATDTNLNKKVAIKEYVPSDFAVRQDGSRMVPKSVNTVEDYKWGLEAFINEAKTLAQFTDANIVTIHRFFQANDTAYIIMEYCEGGCLTDKYSRENPMQEAELKSILAPLMNGLQLVHDGEILHRDIKPDNIMFRGDGTPLLIDFGAARQAIGKKSKPLTTILTPGYAPIEQYSSSSELGAYTDIYALAAVAYTCLTGNAPDDAAKRVTKDEYKPLGGKDKSSFLNSIDKALQVFAENRYQSLSDWYASWEEEQPVKQQTIKIDQKQQQEQNLESNKKTKLNEEITYSPFNKKIVLISVLAGAVFLIVALFFITRPTIVTTSLKNTALFSSNNSSNFNSFDENLGVLLHEYNNFVTNYQDLNDKQTMLDGFKITNSIDAMNTVQKGIDILLSKMNKESIKFANSMQVISNSFNNDFDDIKKAFKDSDKLSKYANDSENQLFFQKVVESYENIDLNKENTEYYNQLLLKICEAML